MSQDKQQQTDFKTLVAKMRHYQQEYSSNRDSITLRAAKKAEAQVDKYLQGLDPVPQGVQTSLF